MASIVERNGKYAVVVNYRDEKGKRKQKSSRSSGRQTHLQSLKSLLRRLQIRPGLPLPQSLPRPPRRNPG